PDESQHGHGTMIDSIAFAPDGKTLATAHHDGFVRLWDPADGRERRRLKGHEAPVSSVRFSPDGKWLVPGSVDNTMRLWEVATGKELANVEGHGAGVRQAEFGPDLKTLLSAGSTEVLLWQTRPAASGPATGDVAALWEELLSPDAGAAFSATWALADRPT